MKFKCIIIDDEPLARELLATYLENFDSFELVASYSSTLEAYQVLSAQKIDLLFLDIEMPLIKGTDFFRNLTNKPKVIFTTAHRKYALEGFELSAVDYLLKPITFQRFFQAIEKFLMQSQGLSGAVTSQDPKSKTYLFVQKNKKNIKLYLGDISYIESFKDYINIYFSSSPTLTIKHSISTFQEKLDEKFIRVHKSYIINVDKITAYTKQDIEIGEVEIPIGSLYKNIFQNRIE